MLTSKSRETAKAGEVAKGRLGGTMSVLKGPTKSTMYVGPADEFSAHISQALFTSYLYCKVAQQSDNAETSKDNLKRIFLLQLALAFGFESYIYIGMKLALLVVITIHNKLF